MKLSNLLLFVGLSIPLNIKASELMKEIEAVESGLRDKVHFTQEPLWNIEERMAHYQIPGVSIAVIKDYKVHWVKSYGVADKNLKTPVTTDTLFQAGSISKSVTAYAALKLVEQKSLSLDSPVNQQLSDWKIPENEFTKKTPVTLKHLLSHSAGLNVHGFIGHQKGTDIPTIKQILNGLKPADTDAIRVVAQPGKQFKYSGGGYTVIQKLMTDVTNMTFPNIMNKLIVQPLKMTNSSFQQSHLPEVEDMYATGYLSNGKAVVGKTYIFPGAAELSTTAEDLAKFTIDIQLAIKSDSSQVLSKPMVNIMLTPVVREFYGLGFELVNKKEQNYFLHTGRVPGFLATLVAHKEKGFGLVIMLNSEKITPFMQELTNSVASHYQWDKYISPIFKKLQINKHELQRITGRYKFQPDVSFEVYTANQRLYKKEPLQPSEEMFKVGENEFITKTDDTIIRFQKNAVTGAIEYGVEMGNGKFWGRPRLQDNEKMPLDLVILGKVEEAEKSYLKFFEERPKFKNSSEIALLQTIDKLDNLTENHPTLQMLEMSTRLYPNGSRSWKSLADYYLQRGDKGGAIQTYEKALKFQPENEEFKLQIDSLKENA